MHISYDNELEFYALSNALRHARFRYENLLDRLSQGDNIPYGVGEVEEFLREVTDLEESVDASQPVRR